MDEILEALLRTMPTADGRDDEFEALWEHAVTTRPEPTNQPLGPITVVADKPPSTAAPAATDTTAIQRVPKIGTWVQRSTATNARKLRGLLETPPPPPWRVHGVTRGRPVTPRHSYKKEIRKTLTDLFGGTLSDLSEDEPEDVRNPEEGTARHDASEQPTSASTTPGTPSINPANTQRQVTVTTDEGLTIQVPFYAVHVSRRYKTRVGHRRITLRFNRSGKLRSHRE